MSQLFDMTIRQRCGDSYREVVWGAMPYITCITFQRMYPDAFVAMRERAAEVADRQRRPLPALSISKPARRTKSALTEAESGTYAGVINKMVERSV